MSELEISQAYHCAGKTPYRNYAKALHIAECIRLKNVRENYVDPRGEMEVYECSNCGFFHLGHPLREKQTT